MQSQRRTSRARWGWFLGCGLAVLVAAASVLAADQPQWGQRYTRNMVSDEKNLPDSFDPVTGKNVKWSAALGTETYGSPVVAGGRVFIGTNNGVPRDPRHKGDRGVLMCLDEKDGRLLWQLVVPKLEGDVFLDWPSAGLCSPPTVEGDRVYVVSNRGEVMALDLLGQANGNDGPYKDEGRHMALKGQPPLEVTPLDADILWLYDLVSGVGIHQHDSAHASILLDGPFLYLNTSNGVDKTHRRILAPDAPSLVVIDKVAGKLLAKDDERIGDHIVHCTWSSPALGEVGGKRLIFFGGPDGIVRAFEALQSMPAEGKVEILRKVWWFDCDPAGVKQDVHKYMGNRKESASNIKGMPVFYKNRVYVAAGGDIWWGKNQAWLKCIDATGAGDVTKTGELWSYPVNKHCCATPSIANGLVFVTDCGKTLHCLDAETGKSYWTHEAKGEFWGSPLVADGKVYATSLGRDLVVLAAEKEKKVLATVDLGSRSASTPVAANGVLYICTYAKLFAVAKTAP